MARLSDIAKEVGVSVSLVSRVLNNDPSGRATEETRRRVREVAAAMGYRPHQGARALRAARTDTIALAVPVLVNAIFGDLLRGVEDEARRHGYTLVFARSESFNQHQPMSQLVDDGRVDGYLLQRRDDESDEELVRRIDTAPVVILNSVLPHRMGSVMIDDVGATDMATTHLLDLGHRRLALVNGYPLSETARRRGLGFAAALTRAGLDPEAAPVTRLGYAPASAGKAVEQLFGGRVPKGKRPTALVVANVNAAIAVLTELRRCGLHVPNDVSVVAVHDAWTADHSWPPLTTIRLPLYEQGREAVAMLHRALQGDQAPLDDVVLTRPEPVLIERESTRPGEQR